ncbi:MAG: glycosyltransferase family 4 protein [Candidatus Portnoybacteria bacterium]|nr:glycosyltransferase family 4 protein [Candidatus Portnoybacteria bacterium]
MKLIYLTNARIPTEKAHGLQIMKMCEGFSKSEIRNKKSETNSKTEIQNSKLDVELIVPRRHNLIKQDPFEYYGVKRNFKITRIFCFDLLWLGFGHKLAFYLQSFSFSKMAVLYALFKYGRRDNIFYSRDYITLFFLCLLGLKPVAEIHDYRSGKPRWWMNFIVKKSAKIICNSEGTKESLLEHYPSPSEKTLVAPNGVDVGFFDIKETKEEARKKLDMTKGETIIGYVGRLEVAGGEKGVSSLIQAFAGLREVSKGCILYIIGGPNELIEKYKVSLKEWGVAPEKVVFTGQVEYRKIPLYLKAIDIVVMTPPEESKYAATTSPIKLFEYLAAGKAIVAPDLPAWRAILNEQNALFFNPADQDDLAKKIKLLDEDKNLVEGLSGQALEDAKNYTWAKRVEKIISFAES